VSVVGGRGIETLAKEVAKALQARGEASRGPRPSRTWTEDVWEGFFGLRRRSVTHHDDGGTPRFWIIGAHRADGEQAIYHPRPGQTRSGHSSMAGHAAILLEDGSLRSAYWREDPIGSHWVISDIEAIDLSGMTMLDRADEGEWKKARTSGREQYREKFERNYVSTTGPGRGFYWSVKRLRNGEGVWIDGVATGMSARPRGPDWSLDKPE
jgi:hypothetical protein